MSDSITCAGNILPEPTGRPATAFNRRSGESRQKEAARLARMSQYVVVAACEEFGVPTTSIIAKIHSNRNVVPRHFIWFILRNHPDGKFSYPVIAELFERDHTSVIYGVRRSKALLEFDHRGSRMKVQRICNRLSFHGFKDWKVSA